jgi:drug/metabolite transporter (DMT)-like permease
MSLKRISSTMVAILGAFEPLTAMAIGIIVFGEPLTISVTAGFAMIISAVILLIIKK